MAASRQLEISLAYSYLKPCLSIRACTYQRYLKAPAIEEVKHDVEHDMEHDVACGEFDVCAFGFGFHGHREVYFWISMIVRALVKV